MMEPRRLLGPSPRDRAADPTLRGAQPGAAGGGHSVEQGHAEASGGAGHGAASLRLPATLLCPVLSLGLCPQKPEATGPREQCVGREPVSAVGRRQPQDADPGLALCSGVQGVRPGTAVKPQLPLQPALGGALICFLGARESCGDRR